MEEAPHKDSRPQKNSNSLSLACAAFAGFGLLLLLPALFFSLGPLISTRGRAWEYEPVRELFIISVVVFVLVVVLPLVAAYRLSRRRGGSKGLLLAVAVSSALVGVLFTVSGIHMGSAGSVIIIAPCFALSVYALWSLLRKGAV